MPASTYACEYQLLDSGIHLCVWHKNDNSAVEEYTGWLSQIYAAAEPYRLLRWLHRDAGTGLPAIQYFMYKMRDLERRYPDRPPNRSAVLYGVGVKPLLLQALATLTTIRGKDKTHFFPLRDEALALTWLMHD